MITQRELKEIVFYDPLTGVFTWKRRLGRAHIHVGDIASGVSKGDYWRIGIKGCRYFGHQLAWFYMYGWWSKELDHKDTVKTNNAIANLRNATRSQNNMNRKSINKLGFKGVQKRSENCYSARIKVNGITHRLGHFRTPEEAHASYEKAATVYFGEFART